MRTEMTKSVGFDKFWDDGGAVTPDEAAQSLVAFIDKFDLGMTGEYWAPRGPRYLFIAFTSLVMLNRLSGTLEQPSRYWGKIFQRR